jgi:hypothetical protein
VSFGACEDFSCPRKIEISLACRWEKFSRFSFFFGSYQLVGIKNLKHTSEFVVAFVLLLNRLIELNIHVICGMEILPLP